MYSRFDTAMMHGHRGTQKGPSVLLILVTVIFGCVFQTCSSSRETTTGSTARGEDPVLVERREKDREFKSGKSSPIAAEDRGHFQGLAYFDLNPNLRFRVKLNRYPEPRNIRLGTNTGEMRDALRYGYFDFQVDGRDCRLQVYRVEDTDSGNGPSLFIPYRDATTGKESYGAGRYIDLKENTTGYYDLDFNRAYNPYCAYGKGYSCPVPPSENTLAVPIRAGEKSYPPAPDRQQAEGSRQ
ncbi:MAG TPA: DUF1684 domain-containing protein [Acidobacteriota bacterium]|nr:DUF1684 domain-containing protein [Acidobacteriota bacterium]